MNPQKKIRALGLLASVLLVVFCQVLRTTEVLEPYENDLRDVRYRARPTRTSPSDLVIVVVDAKALDEIKIPYSLWSEMRARAMQSLSDTGARVIAPDLLWEFDPESVLEYGEEFGPVAEALNRAERALAITTIQGPIVLGTFYNGTDVIFPRPVLQGAAGDRLALLNLNEDIDGCMRTLMSHAAVQGQDWPFFAYRIAQLAANIEQEGDYWIDYRGPSGSFPTISLSECIGEELSPEIKDMVRDKIVLLGSYDPRLGDRHRSPFSKTGQSDMFGVEVHANGVETLLTGNRIKEAPLWLEIALSLALALATTYLLCELSLGPAFLGCACLMAVASAISLWSFTGRNLWIGWADKLLLMALVGLTALALRHTFVERLRKQMRKAFERYIPFSVATEILDDASAIELGGTDYEVTVLFSDITNFSTTSERVTPQELLVLINNYFREMTLIIKEHGGTIRQFVGDEIMVIFGAPHRTTDHARKAIQTALAMERRLAELKKANPNDKDGFYENKIGLHTGQVLCGNVGSELRMEYTAVGDNVNIGARIMGLNKNFNSKILLSKDTIDQAGDVSEFNLTNLGIQNVKGREGGIEVYELRL